MVMYFGNAPRTARFSLKSSHRKLRLGVSHREVPSAWSAPAKDRDDREPPAPARGKRKGR